MNVHDVWMTFARTQTAHICDIRPSSTSEGRSRAQASLLSHRHALDAVQSMLGQRANWLASIYLLPDDILTRIFVYVCAARSPNAHLPTDLMVVSRRWHSIIDAFPSVWAYPPLFTSRAKIDTLLSRSKSVVLHLDWKFLDSFMLGIDALDGEGVLSPLLSRSRTIALEASSPVLLELMSQFGTGSPASTLVSLAITVDSSWPLPPSMQQTRMTPDVWPTEIFDTPQLRELKVDNFSYLDWSHPFFCSTLTSLEISFYDSSWVFVNPLDWPGLADAAPCTYDRLLDTLERLPHLEKLLLLRCVTTTLLLDQNVAEGRRVNMKNLRSLNVYDSSRACATLSQNISLSQDAVAVYVFHWAGQTDIDHIVSLGTHNPSIGKAKKPCLLVSIADNPGDGRSVTFNFFDEGRVGRVVVNANVFPPFDGVIGPVAEPPGDALWYREAFATMAASLPLGGVRYLDVEVDANSTPLPRSVWLDSFSRACAVRGVIIQASSVPMLSSALCSRFRKHGALAVIFPCLKKINILDGSRRDFYFIDWVRWRLVKRGRPAFKIYDNHDPVPHLSPVGNLWVRSSTFTLTVAGPRYTSTKRTTDTDIGSTQGAQRRLCKTGIIEGTLDCIRYELNT